MNKSKWHPRKQVLVPTDFSDPTVDAIHTALEFVERGDRVHVVYVLNTLDTTSPGVLLGHVDDESRIKSARHHLEEYLKRHQFEGLTTDVVMGDPGFAISDYVAAHNIDLVVMPSHGYHGVRRVLLGSVAERVLRHAACPVLILRRNDHDHD